MINLFLRESNYVAFNDPAPHTTKRIGSRPHSYHQRKPKVLHHLSKRNPGLRAAAQ
jgi:hypothetical protein